MNDFSHGCGKCLSKVSWTFDGNYLSTLNISRQLRLFLNNRPSASFLIDQLNFSSIAFSMNELDFRIQNILSVLAYLRLFKRLHLGLSFAKSTTLHTYKFDIFLTILCQYIVVRSMFTVFEL